MMCPFCREGETKVIDSRASDPRDSAQARMPQLRGGSPPWSGSRIPQSGEEGRHAGTVRPRENPHRPAKACYKRPVSESQIENAICDVEADVYSQFYDNFDREVPARFIGEKVFNALRAIDQVAFVRFASVYREFKDVNDFVEELEPMLRSPRK
jgi:transcriptional repressor NrdR